MGKAFHCANLSHKTSDLSMKGGGTKGAGKPRHAAPDKAATDGKGETREASQACPNVSLEVRDRHRLSPLF